VRDLFQSKVDRLVTAISDAEPPPSTWAG